ncbi:hypothetical protein BUALT_Bualt15G0022500 [Buddleja alternifolia]|uniref:F-box protein n=1 Tax=Buddleja alternifolia TaxID=168488 RepID=A0AAV6WMK8_9LAMI|nr:hypothetical protein BUALT_Bualt15G0022500 [Buddleja alternifolia]
MPDRLAQSANDTDRSIRQSVQSYESVWMSHWMRTSSGGSEQTRNRIETKTSEIVNVSFKMSSKRMGNEGMHSSLFKYSQEIDDIQAPRPVFGHNLLHGKAANEISPRRCHFPGEGTSKNPLTWLETDSDAKCSSFATPKPSQEIFVESSSHILPYGLDLEKFGKEKAAASPLFNANVTVLEHDHEKKKDSHSQSDNDCYSLRKLYNCAHDVEATRICSTMDMVERMPASRFSQTTHRLLITKKTDVNLSKENDVFRSTRVAKIKGNVSSDLHSLWPFSRLGKQGVTLQPLSSSSDNERNKVVGDVKASKVKINGNVSSDLHSLWPFSRLGKQGVTLQPLSSSSDNERNKVVGDVKASKVTIRKESSADTETMDMDSFKEKNPYSGTYSTTSTKAFNKPPRMYVASSREVVPDINLELPASLSENACPGSSRTQSLEMDKLLANADRIIPKSNLSMENSQDPGNRWVKRLKLNSSISSAQGTKGSNLAENLSHEKVSKLFTKILKSGIASEEPMQSHKEDTKKKGKELLLSHTWIQRWLSNRSRITEKKPEAVVVCEPQRSKLTVENLRKEQFPSIAAMALMGKAITCFQPCELQKRGSFTIWNTKAF